MPKNPQQQQLSTTSTTAPKWNTFFRTDFYNSESLMKFIKSVTIRNKNTARQYHLRLSLFAKFIQEKYKIDLDKFLQQLKRQGADLETKIGELQDINQVLREQDKMKEDVIANLSDKLIMLSERLDIIERSK